MSSQLRIGPRRLLNFKFTAKFRVITHDKRLKDIDHELEQFFKMLGLVLVLRMYFEICWDYRKLNGKKRRKDNNRNKNSKKFVT
ncbi:MAG: hypothetical protein WBZ36_03450 [Candidatus Nitrosopolaris sp.]